MTEKKSLWGLRLLALGLAVLAWFLATAERREQLTATKTVEAYINYTSPDQITILDPVEKVRVNVRGTPRQIQNLFPFQVGVRVDLRGAEKGAVEVNLGAANVDLPSGLEMDSIEPNKLVLTLDRVISEIRPVEPNLVGEPAAGAVILRFEVLPAQVLVSGPESLVGQLQSVSTSPVSLDGHALNFEERAAVVSPDAKIRIVQPALVTVRVALEVPNIGAAR